MYEYIYYIGKLIQKYCTIGAQLVINELLHLLYNSDLCCSYLYYAHISRHYTQVLRDQIFKYLLYSIYIVYTPFTFI